MLRLLESLGFVFARKGVLPERQRALAFEKILYPDWRRLIKNGTLYFCDKTRHRLMRVNRVSLYGQGESPYGNQLLAVILLIAVLHYSVVSKGNEKNSPHAGIEQESL